MLEKELGRDVETVTAGVNGYSSWREHLFLEREGLKYQPDAVIVGFVLNDVTEPLGLVRFGGAGSGHQLSRSYYFLDDWLQHNSALYWLAQRLTARMRFGTVVQKDAEARQLISVKELAVSHESHRVRKAWSLALASLGKLIDLCAARGVQVATVVFPFTFQFQDPPGLATPQQVLKSFYMPKGVPCLDLPPLLADYLRTQQVQPEALFLDSDHLSVRNSEIVAKEMVPWLRSETDFWSRIAPEI